MIVVFMWKYRGQTINNGNPILNSSVADPERFDADPYPTFHADADPDAAPDPKLV